MNYEAIDLTVDEDDNNHNVNSAPPKKRQRTEPSSPVAAAASSTTTTVATKEEDCKALVPYEPEKTNVSKATEKWCCPVCLDELGTEGLVPCVITSCHGAHMICGTCLFDLKTKKCPICSKAFTENCILPLVDLLRKDDAVAFAFVDMNFDKKADGSRKFESAVPSSSSHNTIRVEKFSSQPGGIILGWDQLVRATDQYRRVAPSQATCEFRVRMGFAEHFRQHLNIVFGRDPTDGGLRRHDAIWIRVNFVISCVESYFSGGASFAFGDEYSFEIKETPRFDMILFPDRQRKETRRRRLNEMYVQVNSSLKKVYEYTAMAVRIRPYDVEVPITRDSAFPYMRVRLARSYAYFPDP